MLRSAGVAVRVLPARSPPPAEADSGAPAPLSFLTFAQVWVWGIIAVSFSSSPDTPPLGPQSLGQHPQLVNNSARSAEASSDPK